MTARPPGPFRADRTFYGVTWTLWDDWAEGFRTLEAPAIVYDWAIPVDAPGLELFGQPREVAIVGRCGLLERLRVGPGGRLFGARRHVRHLGGAGCITGEGAALGARVDVDAATLEAFEASIRLHLEASGFRPGLLL